MIITTYMVQHARAVILETFPGAPIEKVKHSRNKFDKVEGEIFMRYRISEDVASLNPASLKNSITGRMLTRNECRADGFRTYNLLRKSGCGRTSFFNRLGGKAYGDRKIENAGCDTCIDYGSRKVGRYVCVWVGVGVGAGGSMRITRAACFTHPLTHPSTHRIMVPSTSTV
jgi:hypothetical protein